MIYDTMIIGGGPAGLCAALYASRAGLNTLLLEAAFSGGQINTTSEVENYLGFTPAISGADLGMNMEKHALSFGATLIRKRVSELHLTGEIKQAVCKDETFEAKTVILSMGAYAKNLGVPGEGEFRGKGVSYCATCDGAFYRGKSVAVVGGGDTAVSDALFLSRICETVYLIHRRSEFRAQQALCDQLYSRPNIKLLLNSELAAVFGGEMVERLDVSDKITGAISPLAVSGVFVAIGTHPNSALAAGQLQTDDTGYIPTDEHMATSIPGVFSAGDVRRKPMRQIITAASDGAVAAFSASAYLLQH